MAERLYPGEQAGRGSLHGRAHERPLDTRRDRNKHSARGLALGNDGFWPAKLVRALFASANHDDVRSLPAPPRFGRPPCPKCGARMWLSCTRPDRPGYDRHGFECPRCRHVMTKIIRWRIGLDYLRS